MGGVRVHTQAHLQLAITESNSRNRPSNWGLQGKDPPKGPSPQGLPVWLVSIIKRATCVSIITDVNSFASAYLFIVAYGNAYIFILL